MHVPTRVRPETPAEDLPPPQLSEYAEVAVERIRRTRPCRRITIRTVCYRYIYIYMCVPMDGGTTVVITAAHVHFSCI